LTENAAAWIGEQCTGDWILRLDDDELPSAGLVGALPRLLSDREVTHYWLPRRWVVGADQTRWISQSPWWPDWQLRLFRNIGSLVRPPEGLHGNFFIQGGARFCTEASIYHFDLVYHTDSERQQKVDHYERISPGNSLGHLYLPPAASMLDTSPFPADDPPSDVSAPPAGHSDQHPRRNGDADPRTALGTIAATEVTLADLRCSAVWRGEDDPTLFRASLVPLDCPRTMITGQWFRVDLDLRNDSPTAWSVQGLGLPQVRVGYHWLGATGQPHEREGWRTSLPHTLRPGQTARLSATLFAPRQPGRYFLQWDLVAEEVAWFSARGWRAPSVEVAVVAGQPLQAARLRNVGPTRAEDLGPHTIKIALGLRRLALRHSRLAAIVKRFLRMAG
jgi:hypothetical protein